MMPSFQAYGAPWLLGAGDKEPSHPNEESAINTEWLRSILHGSRLYSDRKVARSLPGEASAGVTDIAECKEDEVNVATVPRIFGTDAQLKDAGRQGGVLTSAWSSAALLGVFRRSRPERLCCPMEVQESASKKQGLVLLDDELSATCSIKEGSTGLHRADQQQEMGTNQRLVRSEP